MPSYQSELIIWKEVNVVVEEAVVAAKRAVPPVPLAEKSKSLRISVGSSDMVLSS